MVIVKGSYDHAAAAAAEQARNGSILVASTSSPGAALTDATTREVAASRVASMSRRRLLIANVYYAPISYGGATVVTENMAKLLGARHGWQVLVLTTFYDPAIVPYTTKRYVIEGIEVIAVCVPYERLSFEETYHNPQFNAVFARVVQSYGPDVAHIHCVQTAGSTFFEVLQQKRIPFAITMHDCWWFCERQFMLKADHTYCHQRTIDFNICRHCVPNIGQTRRRREVLYRELGRASLYLFPSEFFRQLAIDNGLPSEKCIVNKNGIKLPASSFRRSAVTSPDIKLRFGFVGGPGPNKGSSLFLRAFAEINRTDYELVIVDAAQNHGGTWQLDWSWKVPGKLRFFPAYTAETLDGFFSEIDVLLYPSQWKESFGLTVREALARDVWIIATDAGAVSEDCIDGVNSTIIPMSANHWALKSALEKVLDELSSGTHLNPAKVKIVNLEQQAEELSRCLATLQKNASV